MEDELIGNPSAGIPGVRAIAMAADAQGRPNDVIESSPFTEVR